MSLIYQVPEYAKCYLEIENKKKNLVICLGDSWTYGDSLGNTDVSKNIDDFEFRKEHIYGKLLADKLNADLVNAATPGCSNNFIYHQFYNNIVTKDLPRLSQTYNKVYIVITLTENGRDLKQLPHLSWFLNTFKKHYDYENDTNFTFEKFLIRLEQFVLSQIAEQEKNFPANVKLITASNFAYVYDYNKALVKHMVPKIWTEILAEKQNLKPVKNVRMASYACSYLLEFMRSISNRFDADTYSKYVDWYEKVIMDPANKQIDFLNESIYNYKKASKHPTPEGHALWADYLYNYIVTLDNENSGT